MNTFVGTALLVSIAVSAITGLLAIRAAHVRRRGDARASRVPMPAPTNLRDVADIYAVANTTGIVMPPEHARALADSIRRDRVESMRYVKATLQSRAVVTRSGGNARHGTYPAGALTCANVRARGVRRVTTIQTGGDARGAEAQPLYAPNVRLQNGTMADLVIIATMGNVLHAYDLRTRTYAWETPRYLGRPIDGTRAIDVHGINDKWGILSTPVLDVARNVGIACMWASEDGSVAKGRFTMVEFSLATGIPLRWCVLNDVTYDPGHGLPVQRFDGMQRKQRCSLLLDRGNVYVAFGTIAETSSGARGWIVAVDASAFTVKSALTTTARGSGAGIWMAGQGLSADAMGYVYCTTGNGDFDGVTDFGESFLKIGWTYEGSGLPHLKILDWWTAFSDDLRTGRTLKSTIPASRDTAIAHTAEESTQKNFIGDAATNMSDMDMTPAGAAGGMGMAGVDILEDAYNRALEQTMAPAVVPGEPDHDDGMPTNHRRYDLRERMPSGAIPMGAAADMDLGSGGAQPIEKYGIVLGAGKDGISYLVNMHNMGQTKPGDLRNAAQNYAKLLGRPMFFTYATSMIRPDPDSIRDLNVLPDGKTHHMHSTPVYHEGNANGDVVFCWGENERLKAYRIVVTDHLSNGPGPHAVSKSLQWLADGQEWASPQCTQPPGGMPGGMMCLSSNGVPGDAVLWACVPDGDGNMTVTSGRLLAYDANDFSDGTIKKIWDSRDWGLEFVYNKFCPPTIVADHDVVLVANYSGGVDVYQLT